MCDPASRKTKLAPAMAGFLLKTHNYVSKIHVLSKNVGFAPASYLIMFGDVTTFPALLPEKGTVFCNTNNPRSGNYFVLGKRCGFRQRTEPTPT